MIVVYFSDSDQEDDEQKKARKATRSDKPMYLKDYERKIMTENEGQFTDDAESEDEDGGRGGRVSPSYVEEQQHIKDRLVS